MCWRWTFIKPCLNLCCFTRIGACIYLVRTSYTLHRYVTSLDTAICRSTSTLMIRRFMSRSIHQSTVSWSTLRPRLRRAEVTLVLGCLETNWNLTTASPSSWYWRLVIAHCPLLKVGTRTFQLQNQQGTLELCLTTLFRWSKKWLSANQRFTILETLHVLGSSYPFKPVKYLVMLLSPLTWITATFYYMVCLNIWFRSFSIYRFQKPAFSLACVHLMTLLLFYKTYTGYL